MKEKLIIIAFLTIPFIVNGQNAYIATTPLELAKYATNSRGDTLSLKRIMEGIRCPICQHQAKCYTGLSVTLMNCIGHYNEKDEWVIPLCNSMTAKFTCVNKHEIIISWPHK